MIRFSIAILTLCLTTVTAQAALVSRAGGQAHYDDDLNITWLADANYAQTSGFDPDGLMTWSAALAWVGSLNVDNHLGISHWRLPNADVNGDTAIVECITPDPACNDNEMGYLFYRGGVGLGSAHPFANIQPYFYWSSTEYTPNVANAYSFTFNGGGQYADFKGNGYSAWAVADGDALAVVPLAPAAWLFASAFGVMGWIRRKAG